MILISDITFIFAFDITMNQILFEKRNFSNWDPGITCTWESMKFLMKNFNFHIFIKNILKTAYTHSESSGFKELSMLTFAISFSLVPRGV